MATISAAAKRMGMKPKEFIVDVAHGMAVFALHNPATWAPDPDHIVPVHPKMMRQIRRAAR